MIENAQKPKPTLTALFILAEQNETLEQHINMLTMMLNADEDIKFDCNVRFRNLDSLEVIEKDTISGKYNLFVIGPDNKPQEMDSRIFEADFLSRLVTLYQLSAAAQGGQTAKFANLYPYDQYTAGSNDYMLQLSNQCSNKADFYMSTLTEDVDVHDHWADDIYEAYGMNLTA